MATSGIPNSVTFTPLVAGKVIVTCTFNAQRVTGSDWGSGANYKVFLTQDGTTTYGDAYKVSTSRLAYSAKYSFDVIANEEVECGLFGEVTGASSVNFYDIQVVAEHIKR